MRVRKEMNVTKLKKAALGLEQCDLTITNVKLFNTITEEIYDCEVDVCDGYVVRVRENEEQLIKSKNYYDGKGYYLLPGLIDAHMHVESTMMIPENLSRTIVPWGTTTICTDPHEIANACGLDGVKFMIDNSKNSKLRQYVLAPSCVCAVVGLEQSYTNFTAKEIGELLDLDGVIGLAEVMDYLGVVNDEKRMHEIVNEAFKRDMYIQGHSPQLSGSALAAYLVAGVKSDHESSSKKEVVEKLRNGMHINLRSSSLVDNSNQIAEGVKQVNSYDYLSMCTDDIHAKDLLTTGHLNYVIKKYMAAGIDPKKLYKIASLNAAREYNFEDLGAIAPGYLADMQIIKDFNGEAPVAVFIEGQLVAENGEYIYEDEIVNEYHFVNSMNVKCIDTADDFKLKVPEGYDKDYIDVNVVCDCADGFNKEVRVMSLPVVNGCVDISNDPSLIYVCNCNRYGKNNKTIAIYKDFGLKQGALASSIAHDSHNLNICYHDSKQAYRCLKELEKCGGGICIINKDDKARVVKLPIGGLMSDLKAEDISKEIEDVQKDLSEISDSRVHVLSTAVMSLTVLPSVVISDLGLVDGNTQTFINVFENV